MVMGHTLDALRSRNSASLAPRPATGRQSASMVGTEVVPEKTSERLRLSWVVGARYWAFLLTVKRDTKLGFHVNSETRHRGSEQVYYTVQYTVVCGDTCVQAGVGASRPGSVGYGLVARLCACVCAFEGGWL